MSAERETIEALESKLEIASNNIIIFKNVMTMIGEPSSSFSPYGDRDNKRTKVRNECNNRIKSEQANVEFLKDALSLIK